MLASARSACCTLAVPNQYLLSMADGSPNELSADGYERDGDDWVFHLDGVEVARIPIDQIVSIAKARQF